MQLFTKNTVYTLKSKTVNFVQQKYNFFGSRLFFSCDTNLKCFTVKTRLSDKSVVKPEQSQNDELDVKTVFNYLRGEELNCSH